MVNMVQKNTLTHGKYGPQREKTYRLTCAANVNSNQPAHPYSLIIVFVALMKKLCILGYPK